jgi:hypothetical protein
MSCDCAHACNVHGRDHARAWSADHRPKILLGRAAGRFRRGGTKDKSAHARGKLTSSTMAIFSQRPWRACLNTNDQMEGTNPMPLRTKLTEKLGISHPILLAPMGTASGGTLAKAVTEAGGLGIIGFGYGNQERIDQEFRAAGNARVGCGFMATAACRCATTHRRWLRGSLGSSSSHWE